jgi:putative ABC transport system permease protein
MSWLRRLTNALAPRRLERDIDREVSFHLAERIDELRAAGLSEDEARRRARVQFGNPGLQAERVRDVDVAAWLDALLRHVRHAARALGRSPGFTLTVVLTLALGIGANTAVFSALDAVLLRPLPFPDADRLVRLGQVQDATAETMIAPVRLEEWNRLASTFEAITGYYVEDASETAGDLPERVRRALVTPRFVDVWGVAPARGRSFAPEEHQFGGPPAILISDRYWHRRFNADPGVLQQSVRLGTTVHPIVGVMPPTFRFPDREVDLWTPVPVDAPFAQSREATWYTGIGRLRSGVTLDQARDNLRAVQAQLAAQYPETDRQVGVWIVPLKQSAIGDLGATLWLVFGAVSVLLLIACTNIAALLLARGTHRSHEIAVRRSLGASRSTIAAQLLTETAVLAVAGGALGLLVAAAATGWLRSTAGDLPRFDELSLDGRILLYTLAVTMAVTLVCGLLPAVRMTRGSGTLHAGDARRTQVSGRNPLQWLLVGAQVTLSVALLAGAGLLLRSSHELSQVDPGFDRSRLLTFRVSGGWGETAEYGRLVQRVERTLERLRAVPGIDAAATTGWVLPGVPTTWEASFALLEARTESERALVAEERAVSPDYFATMRIPLVAGEPCRPEEVLADGTVSARDVMINGAFVTAYLAGHRTPVGLHLARPGFPSNGAAMRIAGIVGDARERGLDNAPGPTVYTCFAASGPTPYFLVRTRTDPATMAQTIRLTMKELEPLRSVYEIAPLGERIDEAFTANRLRTVLLAAFAATALSLACVGLYGTLSYIVGLRRREVGLRLALGALRGDIVRQFLAQGLFVVGLACLCGVGLAVASSRLLAGMLYGVTAADPATFAGVVAIVLGVGTLAAVIPATRAARLDPMHVLRDE